MMVGGQNRGIGHPGVVWQAPLRASVTMGCVAADDDEAFDSVKSMIMRRANNVALAREDQHGNNTDKTAFPGTRRHGCENTAARP
jgi:hypothetical protein